MADSQAMPAGVMDTMQSAVATIYAQGLLDSIASDDHAGHVACQLQQLAELLNGIPESRELLTTELLSPSERSDMVKRIFVERVDEPVEALLAVMARRGRLGVFAGVAAEFRGLLDRRLGKTEVTVRTAFELDDASRESLVKGLSEALGGPVVLQAVVDPELLGGAVVQVGDRVYDGSVASKLKGLTRAMTERLSG